MSLLNILTGGAGGGGYVGCESIDTVSVLSPFWLPPFHSPYLRRVPVEFMAVALVIGYLFYPHPAQF
jgi:hypothetical protein